MRLSTLLLMLLGCQELGIDDNAVGVPNPGDLQGQTYSEVIQQAIYGEVDVLLVVGDTQSMADELGRFVGSSQTFLDAFRASQDDWHLGVLRAHGTYDDRAPDTDGDTGGTPNPREAEGRLRNVLGFRWIDRETPDPSTVFRGMLALGARGEDGDMGAFDSVRQLDVGSNLLLNEGFRRGTAALHLVMMGDQDDTSEMATDDFIAWLTTEYAPDVPVRVHAVTSPDPDVCGKSIAPRVLSARSTTLGLNQSICGLSWPETLAQSVSRAVVTNQVFPLAQVPDLDTLEVTLVDGDWTYVGVYAAQQSDVLEAVNECGFICVAYRYDEIRNAVSFYDVVPRPEAEIRVSYKLRRD
jgi:hypothetical protein